jgi:hypothetical protein
MRLDTTVKELCVSWFWLYRKKKCTSTIMEDRAGTVPYQYKERAGRYDV